MTALDVYFHSDLVGRLERLHEAKLKFTYECAWAGASDSHPLSLFLPLREEPFEDAQCRPFFSGLLPEGEFLKAVARAFHVSADNPFSVLAEIGGECAGAVSLVSAGSEPPFASAPPPAWLGEAGLADLLAELPTRPLLVGQGEEDGMRLSLAGARDKLPVLARDGELGLTWGHPPSTHIVKKPIPNVSSMVANEAFCMSLASEVGLTAAKAVPVEAGDQEGLLVTRYDRTQNGGEVHRIHQEDFCQALGFLPEQKYEADGGPGVAACATLLREHAAAPAVDLFAFLDALVFNLLIGNADAHSKNYSLLLEGERTPCLAPLYDLLCTRVYGVRLGRKMAMKYGGEYRFDRIRGRHLERLAMDLELSASMTRRRVKELVERVAASFASARAGLPEHWQGERVIDAIEEVIQDAAERLAAAAIEPA